MLAIEARFQSWILDFKVHGVKKLDLIKVSTLIQDKIFRKLDNYQNK